MAELRSWQGQVIPEPRDLDPGGLVLCASPVSVKLWRSQWFLRDPPCLTLALAVSAGNRPTGLVLFSLFSGFVLTLAVRSLPEFK